MSANLSVALLGFPAPEQATFETFFRLVSPRRPAPLAVVQTIASAHVILWNAADGASQPPILSTQQRLIAVSNASPAGVWRHIPRPVNLNAVLQALDAATADLGIVGASAAAAPRPAIPAHAAATMPALAPISIPVVPPIATNATITTATPRISPPSIAPIPAAPSPAAASLSGQASLASVVSTLQTISNKLGPAPSGSDMPAPIQTPSVATPPVRSAPAPVSNVAPIRASVQPLVSAVSPASAPVRPAAEPAPSVSASAMSQTNILVVDDSDVALRFMHSRLSAFGFSVALCTSGEEALVRVADGDYAFVFLDVMMEGLDGYQTCKAIKGRKYPGGRTPTVVMLTSRGGTIDKVRGTFAGCDAYLTKPLDESKMLKVLLRYSPELADSVSTLGAPRSNQAPGHLPSAAQSPTGAGRANPLSASFENLPNGTIKSRT